MVWKGLQNVLWEQEIHLVRAVISTYSLVWPHRKSLSSHTINTLSITMFSGFDSIWGGGCYRSKDSDNEWHNNASPTCAGWAALHTLHTILKILTNYTPSLTGNVCLTIDIYWLIRSFINKIKIVIMLQYKGFLRAFKYTLQNTWYGPREITSF